MTTFPEPVADTVALSMRTPELPKAALLAVPPPVPMILTRLLAVTLVPPLINTPKSDEVLLGLPLPVMRMVPAVKVLLVSINTPVPPNVVALVMPLIVMLPVPAFRLL